MKPLAWLVALAVLLGTAVFWGRASITRHYEAQAVQTNTRREAVAAPIAAQQEQAQARVRTVFKTITKEVPVYVQATDCPLPAGYRVLHDAAAHGVVPDPASLADATPVAAQDAAATTVGNYEIAHATAERLVGLQAWVHTQQTLKP